MTPPEKDVLEDQLAAKELYKYQTRIKFRVDELEKRALSDLIRMTPDEEFELVTSKWLLNSHLMHILKE